MCSEILLWGIKHCKIWLVAANIIPVTHTLMSKTWSQSPSRPSLDQIRAGVWPTFPPRARPTGGAVCEVRPYLSGTHTCITTSGAHIPTQASSVYKRGAAGGGNRRREESSRRHWQTRAHVKWGHAPHIALFYGTQSHFEEIILFFLWPFLIPRKKTDNTDGSYTNFNPNNVHKPWSEPCSPAHHAHFVV